MEPLASPDGMLYWLTHACAQARERANRKQVSIAASVKPRPVDQSTVDRFEEGRAWPRNADKMVRAYADDLDIDPIELWAEALRQWQTHAADGNVIPLDLDSAVDEVAERAAQSRMKRQADDANGKRHQPRVQAD